MTYGLGRRKKMREFGLLVIAVLLLAGCGGVQDDPSAVTTDGEDGEFTTDARNATPGEPTVAESDGISVRGGTLSVNATAVFRNLLALIDVDTNQPIIVIENRAATDGDETSALPVDDFGSTLGLTPPEDTSASDRPGGFTVKGTVHIVPGNGSDAKMERLLAHEFVHVVQYQKEWPSHSRKSYANSDANTRLLSTCLSEGAATYVTDKYVRRYSVDVESDTALMRREYFESNGTEKYFYAPYYFCSRHLHSRLDSPSDVAEAYRNPPVTTEQVIHNYTPQEELPKDLDVMVDETNASWDLWTDSTKGELFTRVVLANVLSEEEASRAATGWGNDRLLEFRDDGRRGYVWLLRWDSADDADQFVQSFDRYLEARGAGPNDCVDSTCFEQRRLGPKTSAVLVGRSSFVSNVTVEQKNAKVTVETA
jgi:hypothetical protein